MRSVIISLLASIAIAMAGSCSSPFDIDTARVDSVLESTVKLRGMTVMVLSGSGTFDTTAIGDWRFRSDTLAFRSTRSEVPPRISMYTELVADGRSENSVLTLERLHIRLDDVPADDTIALDGDPALGRSGVHAELTLANGVTTKRYVTDRAAANYTAVGLLKYTADSTKRVDGTIQIILQATPMLRFRIVAGFDGSSDD